jgi:hypothetical protein
MHIRDFTECNHVLHAILTLFFCGLWFPVWIISAMNTYVGPWVCSQCGTTGGGVNPFGEPQPPPVVEKPKYRLGPKV